LIRGCVVRSRLTATRSGRPRAEHTRTMKLAHGMASVPVAPSSLAAQTIAAQYCGA
jgi:hypothetical protein